MVQLKPEFDVKVVLLSIALAFLGSYMTISFCEQFRLCCLGSRSQIFDRTGFFLVMACCLGGVAIWSMHFVGMSSMSLKKPDGSDVAIQFAVIPTLISLFVVVLLASAGLYVSSFDDMFAKTKHEIVELSMSQLKASKQKMTAQQIRKISNRQMIMIITSHSLYKLLLGGLFAGTGVSVMHYLGMWAIAIPEVTVVWDIGIIAVSILIALIASTAAFWILFRLLSLFPKYESLRVASALVMTIAVCGMHYTGMAAATFHYHDSADFQLNALNRIGVFGKQAAFNGSLGAAIAFCFLLMICAFADFRTWHYDLMADVDTHNALLEHLRKDPHQAEFINAFMQNHSRNVGHTRQSFCTVLYNLVTCNSKKVKPDGRNSSIPSDVENQNHGRGVKKESLVTMPVIDESKKAEQQPQRLTAVVF